VLIVNTQCVDKCSGMIKLAKESRSVDVRVRRKWSTLHLSAKNQIHGGINITMYLQRRGPSNDRPAGGRLTMMFDSISSGSASRPASARSGVTVPSASRLPMCHDRAAVSGYNRMHGRSVAAHTPKELSPADQRSQGADDRSEGKLISLDRAVGGSRAVHGAFKASGKWAKIVEVQSQGRFTKAIASDLECVRSPLCLKERRK